MDSSHQNRDLAPLGQRERLALYRSINKLQEINVNRKPRKPHVDGEAITAKFWARVPKYADHSPEASDVGPSTPSPYAYLQ